MHEAALAQAAQPAPTLVLGLVMRPYSIGHELRLLPSETPSSNHPTPIGREDLERAALICCESFEEGQRPDLFLGIKRRVWRWRTSKLQFSRELAAFLLYQARGSMEFPISDSWRPEASGPAPRPPGAPFLIRLQQFLMVRLGMSESMAWNYPLGLAKMRWAAYWEQEGGLAIANEYDAAHAAFVAAEEAKAAGNSQKEGGKLCRA